MKGAASNLAGNLLEGGRYTMFLTYLGDICSIISAVYIIYELYNRFFTDKKNRPSAATEVYLIR